MLVLTRRPGESLVIGHDVVVTVLEVRGEGVRIGIQAPQSVSIHRAEVYEQITAENTAAASTSGAHELLTRAAPTGSAEGRPTLRRPGGRDDT